MSGSIKFWHRPQKWEGKVIPGPWDDEPDTVQWFDDETGFDCIANRGALGSWCGYAGVRAGHPAYGVEYDAVEDTFELIIHGGLAYAAPCHEPICCGYEECRRLWWLGFHCDRTDDLIPAVAAYHPRLPAPGQFTYRDLDFVLAEVGSLAAQLRRIADA